jgi:hypothetical protein
MVATHNLTVYQGSDFRMVLELKDESAVLMDLTGYSFRAQARSKYNDTTAAFSATFTLRDQASSTGLVDMHIPAADTALLSIIKESNYLYDVEMVTASGDVKRVLQGTIRVFPEVTK